VILTEPQSGLTFQTETLPINSTLLPGSKHSLG
jgi:hypothetical protein